MISSLSSDQCLCEINFHWTFRPKCYVTTHRYNIWHCTHHIVVVNDSISCFLVRRHDFLTENSFWISGEKSVHWDTGMDQGTEKSEFCCSIDFEFSQVELHNWNCYGMNIIAFGIDWCSGWWCRCINIGIGSISPSVWYWSSSDQDALEP